jgi:hypothetical protein
MASLKEKLKERLDKAAGNAETTGRLTIEAMDQSAFDQLGNTVNGWWDAINDIATGSKRTEFPSMPELSEDGLLKAGGAKMGEWQPGSTAIPGIEEPGKYGDGSLHPYTAGRMTTDDDFQLANILKEAVGEENAQFTRDSYGNTVVIVDGKAFYLNKPGYSAVDHERLVGQLLSFAPISKFFKYGTMITKMTKAALGGTAVSTVRDVASLALGSNDLNPERDVLTGALFALGIPVGKGLAWGSKQLYARIAPWLQGRHISQAGKDALIMAGYDESAIAVLESSLIREYNKLSKLYGTEVAATRLADNALPENLRIPKTTGEITGDVAQQQTETFLESGVKGRVAQDVASAARDRQTIAVQESPEALLSEIGTGAGSVERGVPLATAQAKAFNLRSQDKTAYELAYSNAEKGSTFLPPGEQLALRTAVNELGLFPETGGWTKAIQNFNKLVDEPIAIESAGVNVAKYFDWRREVSAAASSLPYGTEKTVLTHVKRQFDLAINRIIEKGYVLGDPGTIKWWTTAVKRRAKFGKDWQAKQAWNENKLISDLTDNVSGQLKVAPEEAANYVLNANNLGFINKGGLTKGLKTIKERLGELSPEWKGVADEVMLRLIDNARTVTRDFPMGEFKVKAFASGWGKLKKNAPLMNLLFSPSEQRLVNHFVFGGMKAGSKSQFAGNPPNTAILKMLGRPLQRLNLTAPFKARAAFSGEVPVQISPQAQTAAPIAATQLAPGLEQETNLGAGLLEGTTLPFKAVKGLVGGMLQ